MTTGPYRENANPATEPDESRTVLESRKLAAETRLMNARAAVIERIAEGVAIANTDKSSTSCSLRLGALQSLHAEVMRHA